MRRFRWVLVAGLGAGLLAGCTPAPGAPTHPPVGAAHIPKVPAGWKTVRHDGLALDVPRHWEVRAGGASCHTAPAPGAPGVLLRPLTQPGGCGPNPPASKPVATVVFGIQLGVVHGSAQTINDVPCVVERLTGIGASDGNHPWTRYIVRVPTEKVTLSILVGDSKKSAGGARGRAFKILHTLHPAVGV